mmetsp:Transcript_46434/g.100770  ORF Transcript_46434/g.100770 Transcript_46434/m.100770 type:complete len:209 (+) Transcript_46434:1164-1790(+)
MPRGRWRNSPPHPHPTSRRGLRAADPSSTLNPSSSRAPLCLLHPARPRRRWRGKVAVSPEGCRRPTLPCARLVRRGSSCQTTPPPLASRTLSRPPRSSRSSPRSPHSTAWTAARKASPRCAAIPQNLPRPTRHNPNPRKPPTTLLGDAPRLRLYDPPRRNGRTATGWTAGKRRSVAPPRPTGTTTPPRPAPSTAWTSRRRLNPPGGAP